MTSSDASVRTPARAALPPARRRLALALVGIAVLLLPWTAWLTMRLPSRHFTRHWDLAWGGFDVALAVAVGLTAYSLLARPEWVPVVAAITGTLLLCDAWFDTVLAAGRGEVLEAVAEAAAAELPLAALCFWVARDSRRTLHRALSEALGRSRES